MRHEQIFISKWEPLVWRDYLANHHAMLRCPPQCYYLKKKKRRSTKHYKEGGLLIRKYKNTSFAKQNVWYVTELSLLPEVALQHLIMALFKFKIYALNSDLLAFELQKEKKKLFEACFHIVIPLSKHTHCLGARNGQSSPMTGFTVCLLLFPLKATASKLSVCWLVVCKEEGQM